MGRLFIIRHGETQENRDRIIQGQLPGRLTGLGEDQSRDIGKKLLAYGPFDRIVSSDLERAKRTAFLISRELPPCDIALDGRLRERGYGILEGQSLFRLKRWLVKHRTGLRQLAIPGAEAYGDFEARVLDFCSDWIAGHPDSRTIWVTHAGVLRVVWERVLCQTPLDIGNGSGAQLSWTGAMTMNAQAL